MMKEAVLSSPFHPAAEQIWERILQTEKCIIYFKSCVYFYQKVYLMFIQWFIFHSKCVRKRLFYNVSLNKPNVTQVTVHLD